MASYRVELTRSAERDLRGIDPQTANRVARAIQELANEPFPRQSKKLVNRDEEYRVRVGRYRILYGVDQDAGIVTVRRIRHRREAYRNG
jgi:mRNA interferase RelE/StbE